MFARCVILFFCASAVLAADAVAPKYPGSVPDYKSSIPASYNRTRPIELIVVLYGAGDTPEHARQLWMRRLGSRPAILVVPNSDDNDPDVIARIVEDVKSKYAIDNDRVMLIGFSAGCNLGFRLIASKPEMFNAFAGIGYGLAFGENELQRFQGPTDEELGAAAKKTQVYYSIGKQDPAHKRYAASVERLKRLKFDCVCEEPDGPHQVSDAQLKSILRLFDSVKAKPQVKR